MSEYGVFGENGLVEIPTNLFCREAATLPCGGPTAWSALFGWKTFQPGVTVLTQGTDGVSMFAVRFALAGGAQVISTTSFSAEREILKKLGVRHVINNREDKEWGKAAKKLSTGHRGAGYVVEIGGPNTFAHSSVAAAFDGTAPVVGTRVGKNASGSSSIHMNLVTKRHITIEQ